MKATTTPQACRQACAEESADDLTLRDISLDLAELDVHGLHHRPELHRRALERYAFATHGLARAQMAEALRIGRGLFDLPRVDGLLYEGRLSWRCAVLLTRVAVPRYESAWLRLARALPFEEFELIVERSGRGWAPPTVGVLLPGERVPAHDTIVAGLPPPTRDRCSRIVATHRAHTPSTGLRLEPADLGTRRFTDRASASRRSRRAPDVRQPSRAPPPSG
jgi:hypothetical protein